MVTKKQILVVPYIGTWIETTTIFQPQSSIIVVPYIGTWIETIIVGVPIIGPASRTLYRYVD